MRNFCFALDSLLPWSSLDLGSCRLVGRWYVHIVRALVLFSTGIAVRIALAKFHSFGEADAGLHFLPTAWTI